MHEILHGRLPCTGLLCIDFRSHMWLDYLVKYGNDNFFPLLIASTQAMWAAEILDMLRSSVFLFSHYLFIDKTFSAIEKSGCLCLVEIYGAFPFLQWFRLDCLNFSLMNDKSSCIIKELPKICAVHLWWTQRRGLKFICFGLWIIFLGKAGLINNYPSNLSISPNLRLTEDYLTLFTWCKIFQSVCSQYERVHNHCFLSVSTSVVYEEVCNWRNVFFMHSYFLLTHSTNNSGILHSMLP